MSVRVRGLKIGGEGGVSKGFEKGGSRVSKGVGEGVRGRGVGKEWVGKGKER